MCDFSISASSICTNLNFTVQALGVACKFCCGYLLYILLCPLLITYSTSMANTHITQGTYSEISGNGYLAPGRGWSLISPIFKIPLANITKPKIPLKMFRDLRFRGIGKLFFFEELTFRRIALSCRYDWLATEDNNILFVCFLGSRH